jgi:hypothetical protein
MRNRLLGLALALFSENITSFCQLLATYLVAIEEQAQVPPHSQLALENLTPR